MVRHHFPRQLVKDRLDLDGTACLLTLKATVCCEPMWPGARQVRNWGPSPTEGKELPPATARVSWEVGATPTDPRDECDPGQHLDCSFVRGRARDPHLQLMKYCIVLLPRLVPICYVAMDD